MVEYKLKKAGITTREFLVLVLVAGLTMMFLVQILFFMQSKNRAGFRRASCANNLKQMGLVLSMYSSESENHYFPLMQQKDCNGEQLAWSKALDVAPLVPEYIQDPEFILQCPSNAYSNWDEPSAEFMLNPDYSINGPFLNNGTIEHCEMIENSYTYYSHAALIRGESEIVTAESIMSLQKDFSLFMNEDFISNPSLLSGDIQLSPDSVLSQLGEAYEQRKYDFYLENGYGYHSFGEGRPSTEEEKQANVEKFKEENDGYFEGSRVIRRMKLGVIRFFSYEPSMPVAPLSYNLVVMHERIPKHLEFFHPGNGVNVLFLDGHVEFVKNDEAGQFLFGAVGEVVQRRW